LKYFDLDSVKVIEISAHSIQLEVQSPYRGDIFYMATYTSLFTTTSENIFAEKQYE